MECGKPIEYEPEYCCDGRECGCSDLPITAHSLVKQLVDKGYLVKKDNEVRALRVVGQKTSDSLQSQEDLREQNWRLLLENVQLRKKLKQLEKY